MNRTVSGASRGPGLLARAGAMALLSILFAAGAARASEEPACSCARARACYHFLRAPVPPPDDPCPCRKCEEVGRHDGGEVPDGFHPACFSMKGMARFLRRHAASWDLVCSACLPGDDPCKLPNGERCPACGEREREDPFARDPFHKPARPAVAEQLALEKEVFTRRDPIVVYSRHFYLVTDLQKVRVRLQDSAKFRFVDGHEYAHLLIQRAEIALAVFERAFGGSVSLRRPMGIFVPETEQTAHALQERYFRAERTHMVYASMGGSAESTISGGFCRNGFCVSAERVRGSASAKALRGGADYALHHAIRHLVANVAITCWVRIHGEVRSMPRWVFEGAGHWLARRQFRLDRDVYYCHGEGDKLRGSAEEWRERLVALARKGRLRPIEELFGKDSLGQLDHQDHIQAWGYFELCMEEWRRPWIEMLKAVRKEVPPREAFQTHLGCTPEEFHQRFLDRLLGERPSMDPASAPPPEDAPPAVRLDPEAAPDVLAAAIRGLRFDASPDETVKAVFDVLGASRSELVREVAVAVLAREATDAVKRAVVQQGLSHAKPLARAVAARVCRVLRIQAARDGLRELHGDRFWLVRAEAALASAAIEDYEAQAAIREALADRSAKVRVAAMDALAFYGEKVNRQCVPLICENLSQRDWQVRVAACEVLAQIGDHQAIDPLIDRAEIERGRVLEEVLAALRAITRDDLGLKPANWRLWWDREKPNVLQRGGFLTPSKPPEDPEKPTRYAKEPYYGVEIFSERLAYVLDTSRSTHRTFVPDPGTARRLAGDYTGRKPTIQEICREEILRSLASLEPRVHFTVIAFDSAVRVWKHPLVRAHGRTLEDAEGFVATQRPEGETNFHGVLSAALGQESPDALDPDYRDAADTITFLTDGSPTVGEITDVELLLTWSAELNRYARARLHVIAFGSLGVKERFLRRLAAQFDGTFVQLRGTTDR